MTTSDIWLTTKDNVYNPFINYDEWRDFDCDANSPTHPAYCTEAYAMRVLGFRNPLDYSTEAILDELMGVYEEIITINKEMGYDIYEIITREGKRLDHVPQELLMTEIPKAYINTPGGGPKNTPTP